MAIVDQFGRPLARDALKSSQTAELGPRLPRGITPFASTLSPATLRAVLDRADGGSLLDQHRVFARMEDSDAHLAAEMHKRKLALLTLDWEILPPRNATAAEKASAEWLKEVLSDAVDPVEDLILALMDGPGHGFAAVELGWERWGKEWLPSFSPRPQEWFQFDPQQPAAALRLSDGSAAGAELWPFGWVLHTHGKPKTGYLGRIGLYRALLWPWLYKYYGVADLVEYLEAYGLPLILGKYHDTASEAEKASLLQAVVDLGHDARAIMPAQMAIDIQKITSSGDSAPHLALVDWCERAQSKLILGQTMSAEAKSTGIGSGNAEFHREVRHDILEADARSIAATLTRDLCYPLLALNKGLGSLQRCPRWAFDTSEAEDLKLMAEALPELVGVGMTIPVAWAHEKLRIPEPQGDEPVLRSASPAAVLDPSTRADSGQQTPEPPPAPAGQPGAAPAAARVSALSATSSADDPTPASALADRLSVEAAPAWQIVVDHLERMAQTAGSLAELRQMVLTAYGGLPLADLRAVLARGFAAAALAGISDVQDETSAGPESATIHRIEPPSGQGFLAALAALTEPAPPPVIHVISEVRLPEGFGSPPPVTVNVPEMPAPIVNVTVPEMPAPIVNVTVPESPAPAITVAPVLPAPQVSVSIPPRRVDTTVTRDASGLIVKATQIETDL